MTVAVQAPTPVGGIKSYYQTKIEAAELLINQKTQNLRRLEAQRNALNARGGSSVSPSVLRVLSSRFYHDIQSASLERGTAITSRARKLCRGSGKDNGKEQSAGESAAGREIQCVLLLLFLLSVGYAENGWTSRGHSC